MVAEEVIPLSMKEANAPDEPDSGCVEKQEEQMGIFQTVDRLEEAVDALPNTVSAASPSTLENHFIPAIPSCEEDQLARLVW